MSLSTSLKCPRCGHCEQTTKVILAGATIRCPRCSSTFRVVPSDGAPVESNRALRSLDSERLQELFAADDRPKIAAPSTEMDIRVLNESNERLPPRAMGPTPAAARKPVLAGKPLPFHGPRTMIAGILIAAISLAGYAFVRWYVDTVISLDRTATLAGEKRAAHIKMLAGPLSKGAGQAKVNGTSGMGVGILARGTMGMGTMGMGVPQAPPQNRTIAPATAQIGNLVVGVSSAQLGTFDGTTENECLTLTLRVTNLSAKPITYASWSGPARKAILTDQYHNYYNRISSNTQVDQAIEPDRTITDTLQFEKPLAGAVLALDLSIGVQKFEFSLPVTFVQRVAVAKVAPQVAPPSLVLASASVSEPAYSAERDPQIVADVKAAYDEAMRRVEVRVLGKSGNEAARLRKTEKERVIKALATKMDMTVDQIRHMISSS
jgi:DNA-directed RNA polymerase subunit RPC12/RpoP